MFGHLLQLQLQDNNKSNKIAIKIQVDELMSRGMPQKRSVVIVIASLSPTEKLRSLLIWEFIYKLFIY